jgi:hypothetical protein
MYNNIDVPDVRPFVGEIHAMSRLLWSLAVVGALTCSSRVSAQWWSAGRPLVTVYYPVCVTPVLTARVVYFTPVPVAIPVAPAIVCPPPVLPAYAQPTAAPPSSTPLPSLGPSMKKVPEVQEMHFSPDNGMTKVVVAKKEADVCRVGFWNLADRDVTLKIDGQARLLPRGKSVTLNLGRQFVWQVDQQALQRESIPAEKSTLEIVIRP